MNWNRTSIQGGGGKGTHISEMYYNPCTFFNSNPHLYELVQKLKEVPIGIRATTLLQHLIELLKIFNTNEYTKIKLSYIHRVSQNYYWYFQSKLNTNTKITEIILLSRTICHYWTFQNEKNMISNVSHFQQYSPLYRPYTIRC